jgi:adenosyl cobinamide kinase/adenosyl cobinamide phosphate guanylyltransferase
MVFFMLGGHMAGRSTHACSMLTRMAGNQCVMEQQFNYIWSCRAAQSARRPDDEARSTSAHHTERDNRCSL